MHLGDTWEMALQHEPFDGALTIEGNGAFWENPPKSLRKYEIHCQWRFKFWWENPMVGIFQGIFQDYDMCITHARRMVFGITEHIVFVPRWARIMASAPATSDPTEISTDLGCVGYCPLVNSPDSA